MAVYMCNTVVQRLFRFLSTLHLDRHIRARVYTFPETRPSTVCACLVVAYNVSSAVAESVKQID